MVIPHTYTGNYLNLHSVNKMILWRRIKTSSRVISAILLTIYMGRKMINLDMNEVGLKNKEAQ